MMKSNDGPEMLANMLEGYSEATILAAIELLKRRRDRRIEGSLQEQGWVKTATRYDDGYRAERDMIWHVGPDGYVWQKKIDPGKPRKVDMGQRKRRDLSVGPAPEEITCPECGAGGMYKEPICPGCAEGRQGYRIRLLCGNCDYTCLL